MHPSRHVYRRRVRVTLRDALLHDRDRVEGMLADYLFEFDGRTGAYPHLDSYWRDTTRLPLLFEADGEVVGLVLIRRETGGWRIAEFYVVPARRRGGVGSAAVDALAKRARSERAEYLEAKVHPDNREALPFWLASGFTQIDGPGIGVTVTRRAL
jgi:predicted acetyltransferase